MLGQQEFFELMVTQLRNQDPFKPLESGEFLGQIAQFSTVSGINDLKSTVSDLAATMYSNQALQASSLVGRTVMVPGSRAELPAAGNLRGAVELGSGVTELRVDIVDGAGRLARTLKLGPQAAGSVVFEWDGRTESGTPAAPGVYTVLATAGSADGNVALDTLMVNRVEGVRLGGASGGITLALGKLGDVDLRQVRQVM
jgi:flagellar basal-body rod modification protein FlgD